MKRIDLDRSHDRSRGFDLFLITLAIIGIAAIGVGFWRGGGWLVLAFFALIGEILLVNGVYIGPLRLTVRRYREALVREPSVWIRIVMLSDLHAGSFRTASWYERIVQETMANKPDVVLLAGDFVTDRADPVADLACLAKLSAPLGKFFVLGNHDHIGDPRYVREAVATFGFHDISNQAILLEREGKKAELAAVEDVWFGGVKRPSRASVAVPNVLLSHEPDILLDLKEGETDLVLCGHTHGGQVRLPLIGALWPIPSKLGRAADAGRKVWNGIPCIISNGLGETDGRMRLFSPPEIVVVDIGI